MNISILLAKTWLKGDEWFSKWYDNELIALLFSKGENPLLTSSHKLELPIIMINSRVYYLQPYSDNWDQRKKDMAEKAEDVLPKLILHSNRYLRNAELLIERLSKSKTLDASILQEIKESFIQLWYIFLSDIGEPLFPALRSYFRERRLTDGEIDTVEKYILQPKTPLDYEIEELLISQVISTKEEQKRSSLIKKLVDNYSQFTYTELDTEPYDENDILDRIKSYSNTQKNIVQIGSEIERKLGSDGKIFLENVKEYVYIDNYALDLYQRMDKYLADFIHLKHKVSYKDLTWYTFSEIEDLIKNSVTLSPKVIEDRRNQRVMIGYEDEVTCIYDKVSYEKILNSIDTQLTNIKTFTGNSACRGFVKGRVVVIHGVLDLNKIKQGEILVASYTRPELVMAMKKASAIITDMGGITSHAAIVSREFNIPCIVGTNIATQVLKDGDLVEVDANKGIVRILS